MSRDEADVAGGATVWEDGPFFDDLSVGQRIPEAPAITIDEGMTALYQAITGDSLRLSLSRPLARSVTGQDQPYVNPGLVMQVSIGQSTVATRRVVANLFYRGVRMGMPVWTGTTLRTTVDVTALKENRRRPDRAPTGLALLGITTRDQEDRRVLRYERCAMLPLRGIDVTGHRDDVGSANEVPNLSEYLAMVPEWDLSPFGRPPRWEIGRAVTDPTRDPVTDGLMLVRMTQNRALAHRDPLHGQQGRRLLYGGHTVALAQASLTRMVPGVVTILGWHRCTHLAPVFEEELLAFECRLVDAVESAGARVSLYEVTVDAGAAHDGEVRPVLEWSPVVLEA